MSKFLDKETIYDFKRNKEDKLKEKIISLLSEEKLSLEMTKELFHNITRDIEEYNKISF